MSTVCMQSYLSRLAELLPEATSHPQGREAIELQTLVLARVSRRLVHPCSS